MAYFLGHLVYLLQLLAIFTFATHSTVRLSTRWDLLCTTCSPPTKVFTP